MLAYTYISHPFLVKNYVYYLHDIAKIFTFGNHAPASRERGEEITLSVGVYP